MKVLMELPEYSNEWMVQRLSIIDYTGITWRGIARTKSSLETINAPALLKIVESSIILARSGVDTRRVYKYGRNRVIVELMNKKGFINASSIAITITRDGEKIYSLHLDPVIE